MSRGSSTGRRLERTGHIGELTLTLDSELNKHKQIFAPNVLILDQNMTPAAFFPSNYFTYQQPGVMTADRLGGVMRLTPALGQQNSMCWCLPLEKDLQQTTTLLDPRKPMPKAPAMRPRISRIRSLNYHRWRAEAESENQ
ncbi:maltose regulon periplasmic protein [Klebsiella aerogenes]|nr:maltose regulon periplasmic protein [Klebsiella aerogenes]